MRTLQSNHVHCEIQRTPSLLRECSEEVGRHSLAEYGPWKGLQNSRVLVVGADAYATSLVLRLFPENEVSLLCGENGLQRLVTKRRLLLLELEAESELSILRREWGDSGAINASCHGAAELPAWLQDHGPFDLIVCCTERARRTKLFRKIECRLKAS